MASTMPPTVSALTPATAVAPGTRVPVANATAGTPTSTTTLARVMTCTVKPLDLTPRQSRAVKSRMIPNAMAATTATSVLTNAPAYSATAIDTAAADAELETQSDHPTTNPAYGPKTFRANTYCPPDRGMSTPSSAREATPNAA